MSSEVKEIPTNETLCPKRESKDLEKLLAALTKAQGSFKLAKKESTNDFFKNAYADLVSVVKASREFLCANGLSVIQRLDLEEKRLVLLTRLCHASGQWIESAITVSPSNNNIQTLGSYLTYLRRYTYAALVGVVAADEDDDGEKVSQEERKKTGVEGISELEKIRG